MGHSVQHKMAAGALWMLCFKLADRGFGLITTLILARVLAPSDFGVVAMASSFILMAQLMTSFDFDIAIIQNQKVTTDHYSTAWTCNLLLGLSVTLLMLATAAPIADFYRRPDLTPVICALAFGPLLTAAENIGVVAFRKELQFRRDVVFLACRRVLAFSCVVPLAFLLRNHWALVAGLLVSKLASTVTSYLMHPFRPRLTLEKYRQLLVFSRWLLLNNLVACLRDRAPDFFVGRFLGADSLGKYSMAYELSNLPITEISAPINRPALPGFAQLKDSAELAATCRRVVGFVALLALPAGAGLFAISPLLAPVLLGPQWVQVAPIMEVLAINGALMSFHPCLYAVLIGRGFASRINAVDAMYAVILVGLLGLAFFQRPGAVGAAVAIALTSALCMPLYLYQLRRSVGVPLGTFARAVVRPLSAASIMAVGVRWLISMRGATLPDGDPLQWLIAMVASGALIYGVVLCLFWTLAGKPAGPEQIVLKRIRAALAGAKAPAVSKPASRPLG
jgi:O-antigen/teichoic acid export membrane protein